MLFRSLRRTRRYLFVSDNCLSDKRQHYLDPFGSAPVDGMEYGEEREIKEDNAEGVWVVQSRENSLLATRVDPEPSRAENPSPVRDAPANSKKGVSVLTLFANT